jgi:hypothetical protein
MAPCPPARPHATLAPGYSVTTTGPQHVRHAPACISGARSRQARGRCPDPTRALSRELPGTRASHSRAAPAGARGSRSWPLAQSAPACSRCGAGGAQRGGTCWHSGQLKLAAGSTAACVLPTQRGWNQSSHASHCTMYASGLYGSSHTQYLRAQPAPRALPRAPLLARRTAPCRAPGRRCMHRCSGCTLACCKEASAAACPMTRDVQQWQRTPGAALCGAACMLVHKQPASAGSAGTPNGLPLQRGSAFDASFCI